ncbi:hypothetical protein PC128_g15727 [Phytophthora cactorum]|nr:hypothetical protein PC128_g15727 [Phytophthora cactorum]
MSNLPLSFCESELTRQYTNLPAVVVDTLHVNMEIKRFLKPHEEDLEKVLMRKLRALKEAAKLRPETPLPPVLRQETRWIVDLRNAGPIPQLRLLPCKQCRNCPFTSFRK